MHPYSPQPCRGAVVGVATLGGVPHHSFPAVSSRDLYRGGNLVQDQHLLCIISFVPHNRSPWWVRLMTKLRLRELTV